MKELSLFSGIGGGLLGSHLLGWHPVAAVDFEPYCCEVLARRKKDGIFKDPFDIYCMDIGEFNRRVASMYQGKVDIITAGFPCQPFSVAGRKKGEGDERNGWPVTIECIRLVRPRYLLLENVPALLTFDYFGTILGDLSESGYDVVWKVISAAEVGAPHKRDRLWIVADSKSLKPNKGKSNVWGNTSRDSGTENIKGETRVQEEIPNPDSQRCGCGRDMEQGRYNQDDEKRHTEAGEQVREGWQCESCKASDDAGWWDTDPADNERDSESFVGRVAHGIPNRVDRLKGIGNGQVPAVVRAAWNLLSEVINE